MNTSRKIVCDCGASLSTKADVKYHIDHLFDSTVVETTPLGRDQRYPDVIIPLKCISCGVDRFDPEKFKQWAGLNPGNSINLCKRCDQCWWDLSIVTTDNNWNDLVDRMVGKLDAAQSRLSKRFHSYSTRPNEYGWEYVPEREFSTE